MQLTDEQVKLVEENHSLIYWYLNKRKLELSEYYDLLAIELCKAVMHYNPNRGTLATYFKLRADCVVRQEYNKSISKKRMHTDVSYIEEMEYTPIESETIGKLELEELFIGKYGEIARLIYEGYTQKEIADILGVSQTYVSVSLRKLRTELDG